MMGRRLQSQKKKALQLTKPLKLQNQGNIETAESVAGFSEKLTS